MLLSKACRLPATAELQTQPGPHTSKLASNGCITTIAPVRRWLLLPAHSVRCYVHKHLPRSCNARWGCCTRAARLCHEIVIEDTVLLNTYHNAHKHTG